MKRSNRLVLLVGVFLAIVAFVGILVLVRSPGTSETPVAPTTGPVVVAIADIPLSTRIRADQLTVATKDLSAILPGAFTDISQVVGQIARQSVTSGAQITAATIGATSTNGTIVNVVTPPGLRTIAVSVDQVTGVGTLIKTGDYVDMVIGLTADKFPVVQFSPVDKSVTIVSGLNGTSVKLLLQGMQVVGTLLPPVAAPAEQPAASGTPAPNSGPATALNGQTELVILAVTPQQAEVIKFSQMDASVTLLLRSADDFIDPVTGQAKVPETVKTTGVILKTLVDLYGVLPPQIIQTVTPSARP